MHFWVNTGSANQGTDPRFSGSSEILGRTKCMRSESRRRETSTSRLTCVHDDIYFRVLFFLSFSSSFPFFFFRFVREYNDSWNS